MAVCWYGGCDIYRYVVNDRTSWLAGLYGYNGCLVGGAADLYPSRRSFGLHYCGSIVSVIATVSIADILKSGK